MRTIVLAMLLVLPGVAIAQDGPPPGGPGGRHGHGGPTSRGDRLFISPMGEPFRSVKGGAEPQDLWFAAADTDHDGILTRAEFRADAMRFFQTLDRKHDGEIDPEDLEYYETVLAPEIRVAGGGGGGGGGGGDDGEGAAAPVYPDRQGAARYGYFSFPEPVIVADTNFNRGVDAAEFRKAADDRFDVLDRNGDGRIPHDELPAIVTPKADGGGHGRGPGDGGRGRGGGRHGGMGGAVGGAMGGGGMGGGSRPDGGFGGQD